MGIIMGRENIYIIESSETLRVALQQFCLTKVACIYVVKKEILLGQITKDLVINFLSKTGNLDSFVSGLKLLPCQFLINIEDIENVDSLMKEHSLESIPVIDSQNKLLYVKSMGKKEYVVRELVRGDLSCISHFFDNLDGEGKAFFNQCEKNRLRIFKHLTQQEDDFEVHFGVFDKNETTKMVAYFALLEINTMLPWIGLAVDEKYRGQHLGELILDYAESYVKKLGCGGLMLTTAAANIRGQNLYSKQGFVNCGFHVSREYLFLKRFELMRESGKRSEKQ